MNYYHIKGKLYQTSQEKPNIGDLVSDGYFVWNLSKEDNRAEKVAQIWNKEK